MKSVLASLCMSLSMAMTVSGKKADDDLIETVRIFGIARQPD